MIHATIFESVYSGWPPNLVHEQVSVHCQTWITSLESFRTTTIKDLTSHFLHDFHLNFNYPVSTVSSFCSFVFRERGLILLRNLSLLKLVAYPLPDRIQDQLYKIAELTNAGGSKLVGEDVTSKGCQ